MRKRVLSLALALVLCLGLCVVPAGAYDMGKVGEFNIISCGSEYTAAIDENGSLWMWGSNEFGQRGNGSTESSNVPVKVLDDVAAVSCGSSYTAALKTDGTLWMWGHNAYGQLGNGGVGNVEDKWGNIFQTVPVKVMDNVVAVSCGRFRTAAIKTDGTLWTWGKNEHGQLGNGFTENSKVPVKVMDNVAAVSCGYEHTAAIDENGSLWMWGHNAYGQLGNGSTEDSNVPLKIMDNVAAVSCGDEFTAAIKTDGTLWMWGDNLVGVLGNGGGGNAVTVNDLTIQTVPMKIMDNVAAVSCGGGHTAAIKTDGTLWMWGNNDRGQLGNSGTGNKGTGLVVYQTIPVKVLDSVAAVSCGNSHTAAVKTDSTLWVWGENSYGQLGNGGTGNERNLQGLFIQTVPIQITLGGGKVKLPQVVPTAHPSTQAVQVDGKAVEFQCYALKDEAGNLTNYIKLRDLADILNGSAAQFQVGFDGNVTITTQMAYTPNGSEQNTPFSGPRAYQKSGAKTLVNGAEAALEAFVLNDDNGGGYTYYKLRDLGQALGFNVGWGNQGIFIETDKPYDPAN